MPNTPWDVEGWFVGRVYGEAVNCRFQFRTKDSGMTEVWVYPEGDVARQSTLSRSPDIKQMAEWFIQELQHAQRQGGHSVVADPAAPTSGESRIVSLHDYLCRDQADPAGFPDTPAADQVRSQAR
jgi:hypothetical protein